MHQSGATLARVQSLRRPAPPVRPRSARAALRVQDMQAAGAVQLNGFQHQRAACRAYDNPGWSAASPPGPLRRFRPEPVTGHRPLLSPSLPAAPI